MKEVIDTRFLRELSFANQTETKEKVRRKYLSLISKNEGILPTIVLAEITQITCALRGKAMAQSRSQALIQSGLEIQDLTSIIAEKAGILKGINQRLPMGDCIIAAAAQVAHARILSDDPHFDSIPDVKRVWL